jgi:hypothetical protein
MEALRVIHMEKNGSEMDTTRISPEMVGEVPQMALIGGFRKYTA